MDEYFEIVHRSPEIKTVGQFLAKQTSIAFGIEVNEFLLFRGPNNITNEKSIRSMYTGPEARLNSSVSGDMLALKVGTTLYIPKNKITTVGKLLNTSSVRVVSNDVTIFKSKLLLKLQSDTGYVQTLNPTIGREDTGALTKKFPDITVWVWCRSLSDPYDTTLQGQLIDISPFVINVNTNVTKTGGNFSIDLPPVLGEINVNNKWQIKDGTFTNYQHNKRRHYLSKGHIVQQREGNTSNSKFYKRENFYFHNIIQNGDVVFIRMETLKMEEKQRYTDYNKTHILPQDLPGRIYDMIGIVDRNVISSSPSDSQVTISIQGRDCMKLLIDEGSYFFPSQFNKDMFKKINPGNPFILRNLDGRNLFFSIYHYNSIEDVLRFIFNQLASIKVCPDELFKPYGDNRSYLPTKGLVDGKVPTQNALNYQLSSQYYYNALFYVKSARITNNLTLDDPEKEDTICQQVVTDLISYVSQFQNSPGLEKDFGIKTPFIYKGRTFADTALVLRSDFEQLVGEVDPSQLENNTGVTRLVENEYEAFVSVVNYVITQQLKQQPTEPIQNERKGIWQIINLIIDQSVTERRIVDSSLSQQQGSLLSFIQKICQEPFVEFYGDTYGDQYFFTVRKPPFNFSSISGLLLGRYLTEQSPDIGIESIVGASSVIIDINDRDVYSETLTMNDAEIYSWYHFSPKMAFFGGNEEYALFFLPPIVLEEYNAIWGNRPYQFFHNYLPYDKKLKDENTKLLSLIETQAFEDFKFVIDSTVYLPFTRTGSLVINLDRRIKRGDFIRYNPTSEIFYVEAVTHNYSTSESDLQSTTSLLVSRGMVEKYILPKRVVGITNPVSYYNIVNTQLHYEFKTIKKTVKTTKTKEKKTGRFVTPPSVNGATKLSKAGLTQVKATEGYSAKRYPDSWMTVRGKRVQLYSIGYGHQISPSESSLYTADYVMDQQEAERVLLKDIARREKIVNVVFSGLTQNQFDALFDFVYNTSYSVEGFRSKYGQFIKYVKSYITNPTQQNKNTLSQYWLQVAINRGTQYEAGLRIRRREEVSQFFKGIPTVVLEEIIENTTEEVEVETVVEEKVLDREKVFSKFKVDVEIFNFFLRKQQFE